jgi:CHASE2 domain-containing sensor protein
MATRSKHKVASGREEGKTVVGFITDSWRQAVIPAVGCALVGVALAWFPIGDGLALLSYDLSQVIPMQSAPDDVQIIYVDEESFRQFNQSPRSWDRRLYAGLIDFLTRDGARLVVLDVWLHDEGPADADRELARAIRENGKVVLAAKYAQTVRPDLTMKAARPPRELFATAARAWGLTEVVQEFVVRQYFPGEPDLPSLPWNAARVTGAEVTRREAELDSPRWLHYYGTLPNLSFATATNTPPGFYQNKFVFVGSRPKALYPDERPDEFRTPQTLSPLYPSRMPGVEIMATGFLNLQHGTWLRRMSAPAEFAWIAGLGLAAGAGLSHLRLGRATGLALIAMLIVALGGVLWTLAHVWFAWTIPVFVQIPLALGWTWVAQSRRWRMEKADLESRLVESVGGAGAIPDHTLLRPIGRGAYGEVWLARNATGIVRAVKMIRRRWFQDERHYEREFQGIRRFLPVAGSHPGLVRILHVGRRDEHGYFYYVMEAADDMRSGPMIEPDKYVPDTLAQRLRERGRLPVEECVLLGIALADALQHLHERQLIHRDIKPANVLFVQGRPMLADIGLVTDLDGSGSVSKVGTPGYVAPEGPGAPSDIYALGLVLYEVTMGMDVRCYPELPTAVYDAPDYAARKQLNAIIGQACACRVEDRFGTPAMLRSALQEASRGIQTIAPPG